MHARTSAAALAAILAMLVPQATAEQTTLVIDATSLPKIEPLGALISRLRLRPLTFFVASMDSYGTAGQPRVL